MHLTTQDKFEDRKIKESLGLIMGNTVRTRHVGSDILASFRNLIGGEAAGYTKLLIEAREEAAARLIEAAKQKGANGIVCMRFTTSNIMGGMIEILAYGTAVKLD